MTIRLCGDHAMNRRQALILPSAAAMCAAARPSDAVWMGWIARDDKVRDVKDWLVDKLQARGLIEARGIDPE